MTSLRETRCPECDSVSVTVERIEKNRHSLNVRARLTCRDCGHAWEGDVSNPDRWSPWLTRR